jgi:glycosyltransferase involved in cell wall biosynthesis
MDSPFDHALLDGMEDESVTVFDRNIKRRMKFSSHNKFTNLANKASIFFEQTKDFYWLSKEVKKRNVNTILFQSPTYVFTSLILKILGNFRLIWMVPNVLNDSYAFNINRRLYRYFLNLSEIVVLPNSVFTSKTVVGGDSASQVVYPGVDCLKFDDNIIEDQSSMRHSLGISDASVVFCIAASLTTIKGHSEFIRAMARLDPADFDLHLIVCGGPTNTLLVANLKELIQELGLLGRVHFIGPVMDMRPYYKVCDIVVSCTLCPEGFGLSIVEAMASSRPVLAHALGGPAETIVDGLTGWLFSPATVESIEKSLHRCLGERSNWKVIGANGRARVLNMFSVDVMSEKIYRIVSK